MIVALVATIQAILTIARSFRSPFSTTAEFPARCGYPRAAAA